MVKRKACPICGRFLSVANIGKHIKAHDDPDFEKRLVRAENRQSLDHDGLNCKYCGKECKNKNSLVQHECRCKSNPNKVNTFIPSFNAKGHEPWNKGLTKETDERIKKQAEKAVERHKTIPGTFTGHHHTPEALEKIRQAAIDHQLGGWNRKNQIEYNGVKLGSSYEVEVAKSLDENKIRWERPSYILYEDLDKVEHRYYPDFYLPDYDVYLDPKNDYLINSINKNFGYTDLDKIKWVSEQNNVKIIILNKDQLNWSKIKELIN